MSTPTSAKICNQIIWLVTKPISRSLQKQLATYFYLFVGQVALNILNRFNTNRRKENWNQQRKLKIKNLGYEIENTISIKALYPMLSNYSLGFSPLHCLREMKFPISSPINSCIPE